MIDTFIVLVSQFKIPQCEYKICAYVFLNKQPFQVLFHFLLGYLTLAWEFTV